MLSKKSDTLISGPADADSATSGGAAATHHLQPLRSRHLPVRPPWIQSLLNNLPLPAALLLLIPLSYLVESRTLVGPYNQRIVMLVGFNIILAVSLQLINGFSGQFSLGHAGFMVVGAYLAAYPAMNLSRSMTDPAACLLFFLGMAAVCSVGGVALFGLFILLRKSRSIHTAAPIVLMIAVMIWILVDFSRGASYPEGSVPRVLIWSRSIELLQRLFLWVINSGLAPAAKLSAVFPESALKGLCYLVLIVGGGACASIVGLVVGLPALRLRGDYLAIATLGMAEIIRIVIQNSTPLGGALGLVGIPKATDFVWLYGGVVITVVVIWRVAYSAKGRAIMAVREDEIAAAAIGINPTRQKVTAFVIGAFFAGVAGSMYSLHERSITPDSFGMAKSIEIVVMVTLGGLGSISGAILAAIVLTCLPELLRPVADYRMIINSALLVVMMLLRPQGLLGGRELWPRRFGRKKPVATEDRDDRAVNAESISA